MPMVASAHFYSVTKVTVSAPGGQGIVTIVIGDSRQMQRALLAGSFKIVENAVFVLEQRFLRIKKSCECVCRFDLQLCSG